MENNEENKTRKIEPVVFRPGDKKWQLSNFINKRQVLSEPLDPNHPYKKIQEEANKKVLEETREKSKRTLTNKIKNMEKSTTGNEDKKQNQGLTAVEAFKMQYVHKERVQPASNPKIEKKEETEIKETKIEKTKMQESRKEDFEIS